MVTLLNRGGRFENFDKRHSSDGDYVGHKWGKMFSIYVENVAKGRHSFTGEPFSGLPIYDVVRDAAGNPVEDEGYPLKLITYKEITGGQSRTAGDYWLQYSIMPENFVYMHQDDADARGLNDGDKVRIVSASNPDGVWNLADGPKDVVGTLKVTQGLRPGTVSFSWHYGHWAYGAQDVVIDGETVQGDDRRTGGICANVVMRVDPALQNACLTDPIGASASYFDTMVEVVKA